MGVDGGPAAALSLVHVREPDPRRDAHGFPVDVHVQVGVEMLPCSLVRQYRQADSPDPVRGVRLQGPR
ncbi:hypothetical protein, partial [Arthrobacter sp. Hiyo1]|uniref:hypothetical protein n=1 Tax=Arthrobacter sp. Hiyo1 TaxID=1588020 RepID=UPI001C0ED72B